MTPQTGNLEAATLALAGKFPLFASGATRDCFLVEDVIYKVETDSLYNYNAQEWDNYQRIRDYCGDDIRVPEMSVYHIGGDTVLASEYIDGDATGECYGPSCDCSPESPCLDDDLYFRIRSLGLYDLTHGNIIRRRGILYVIDLVS